MKKKRALSGALVQTQFEAWCSVVLSWYINRGKGVLVDSPSVGRSTDPQWIQRLVQTDT